MKDITLVQEYRVTSVIKNAEDGFADFLVEDTKVRAKEYEGAVKKDIGADHVELIKSQVFEIDNKESKTGEKQREILELTERLLKLVSE